MDALTKLLEFVRSRLAARQQSFDQHPDANRLIEYAEAILPEPERAAVLAHLERCSLCREVLALSFGVQPVTSARVTRRPLLRPVLAAAAACLVVSVVALEFRPPRTALTAPEKSTPAPEITALPKTSGEIPAPQARVESPGQLRAFSIAPPVLPHAQAPILPAPPLIAESPVTNPPDPIPAGAARALATSPMPLQGAMPLFSARAESPRAPSSPDMSFQKMATSFSTPRPAGTRTNLRWRIEAGGTLSRSRDGREWTPVSVPGSAAIYALSINGASLWVGGADGGLFHSTDNGSRWTKVDVQDDSGKHLTAAITKIEGSAGGEMKVTAGAGFTWISVDGGQSWQRQ